MNNGGILTIPSFDLRLGLRPTTLTHSSTSTCDFDLIFTFDLDFDSNSSLGRQISA